jgi:hypothetical protein
MMIKAVFAIRDKKRLIAHLGSFEWEFDKYGPVVLQFGEEQIQCRYTACGNQNNEAVVELKLEDSRFTDIGQIEQLFNEFNGNVHIIRKG